MKKLKGYKTYILGVVGLIGIAAAFVVGDMTALQAIQAAWPVLMGMTIRNAIPKF